MPRTSVMEWFVSSLTDAKVHTKRKLAKLYHERWRIETSYLEFKQVFHAAVLRSKKVDKTYKEPGSSPGGSCGIARGTDGSR